MDITDFLNNEYSDSALYMNYRSLPSYIDGLKNSGRKIVYTIKKKNIKSRMKVSSLGSEVVNTSGYLHGEGSIQGAIVTRAADYCGANNLPILKAEGSFGTRFTPDAAAPRYIFTRPNDDFDLVFPKADDVNLTCQEFEGDEIEPLFYVPTVPLLLINGCSGIGVGFANSVLNRSTANMIAALRAKLAEKKVKKDLFIPSWHGFRGTVKEIEDNKFEIRGLIDIDNKKVQISEIPMCYSLLSYLNLLKSLKDRSVITKFIDFSEDDNFSFEVTLSDDEAMKSKDAIMNDLGLIQIETENPTCVDENNAIREFKDAAEIFDAYYDIKIKYLEKRIKSETLRLSDEETLLRETAKFIKEVIKGTINLKLKRADVESLMKTKGYVNIDTLIGMPLYSITADKAAEIEKRWKDKLAELNAFKLETPVTIWTKDLDNLEKELKKEGTL